jgi:hypothetical protein
VKTKLEVAADTVWIRGGDELIWAECALCEAISGKDEQLNLNDVLLWACQHNGLTP